MKINGVSLHQRKVNLAWYSPDCRCSRQQNWNNNLGTKGMCLFFMGRLRITFKYNESVCCVPFTYRLSWVNSRVESGQVKLKAQISHSITVVVLWSLSALPSVKLLVERINWYYLITFALALVSEKEVFLGELNCTFCENDLRLSKILLSTSFLMGRWNFFASTLKPHDAFSQPVVPLFFHPAHTEYSQKNCDIQFSNLVVSYLKYMNQSCEVYV